MVTYAIKMRPLVRAEGRLHNLTIRQLQVFVSVSETGGFGLAAKQLDIAQTSVSEHIEAIEEQLGRRVFVRRSGRKPVLTDTGETLLTYAHRILAEIKSLTLELAANQSHFGERIVFACQRSIAHAILPLTLARFTQEHPAVELITNVGSQEEVIEQVRHGTANLGCFLSDSAPSEINSEVLGIEDYVLIANPDHPLAERQSIEPEELEPFAFVWPPQTSRFGKSLSRILQNAGVRRMSIAARATDYEMFRQLVMANVGITCSAKMSAAPDIAAGRIVELAFSGGPLTMEARLSLPTTKRMSPEVSRLVAQIRSYWGQVPSASRNPEIAAPRVAPAGI